MPTDDAKLILVKVSEVTISLTDANGHDLEGEAYSIARDAVDAGALAGHGAAYHPSDGDTYILDAQYTAAALGAVLITILDHEYSARVEPDSMEQETGARRA